MIFITKHPHNWAVELGTPFYVMCEATVSKGAVTYQWIKDGQVLDNERNSELKRCFRQTFINEN